MDSVMERPTLKSEGLKARSISSRYSALSAFSFENGYRFSATDLGNQGVKINLSHEADGGGAIILPPRKVAECGRWLLNTLGQDRLGLPRELTDILERLSREKAVGRVLKRGDKKKIKDALKVLRS
jgi:hypothetical protein